MRGEGSEAGPALLAPRGRTEEVEVGAGGARSNVFLPKPLWVLGLGFQPGVYSICSHVHDGDCVCLYTCLCLQVSSVCSHVPSEGALTPVAVVARRRREALSGEGSGLRCGTVPPQNRAEINLAENAGTTHFYFVPGMGHNTSGSPWSIRKPEKTLLIIKSLEGPQLGQCLPCQARSQTPLGSTPVLAGKSL